MGTPTDHQVSSHCCLPALILNSFSSHFPFTPENRVPLPKPKPEPFILALKLPRLASSVCTITISKASSPRLFLLLQVWTSFTCEQDRYALLLKFHFFPHFAPSPPSPRLVFVVPSPYFDFSLSCFTFLVCECLISFLCSSPFDSFLNWMSMSYFLNFLCCFSKCSCLAAEKISKLWIWIPAGDQWQWWVFGVWIGGCWQWWVFGVIRVTVLYLCLALSWV